MKVTPSECNLDRVLYIECPELGQKLTLGGGCRGRKTTHDRDMAIPSELADGSGPCTVWTARDLVEVTPSEPDLSHDR